MSHIGEVREHVNRGTGPCLSLRISRGKRDGAGGIGLGNAAGCLEAAHTLVFHFHSTPPSCALFHRPACRYCTADNRRRQPRMSLQIAVAHTGQRLDADPVGFHSIDTLKQWISRETQIPPHDQILLTPRGKHVKPQALLTEVRFLLFVILYIY